MTIQPKRNIKQEKCIAFFKQLDIMTMMEAIEDMKVSLNKKIEERKKSFNQELENLSSMQEKLNINEDETEEK